MGTYTGSYSNRRNPDTAKDAHRPGYIWDDKMGIWYLPLAPQASKGKNRKKLKKHYG
tara:strand:- start:447 stop:617 length:171 start_codon:yes stop_codon:yes gene_type:complete